MSMRNIFNYFGVAIIGLALCSCTAQMRKSRYLERADRFYKAGQYDEAKVEYLKVLQVDPRNALAYARSGQMWAEEGVPLRAGAFLLRAKEFAPTDLDSRIRLARVYAAISRFDDASKEASSVLDQAPDNSDALLALAQSAMTPELFKAAEEKLAQFPKQDSAQFYLATAIIATRRNDVAKFEESVNRAAELAPNLPEVHSALGLLAAAKKDFAKASEEFKKAADLSRPRSTERINYAEFKAQTGAAEEAKSYLSALANQTRDFIAAWNYLAKLAIAQRKYDEVPHLLENVFSRDPDNLEARLAQAQSLIGKGDGKAALEILDRLDQSQPGVPMIKYQLALTHLILGNTVQATTDLEQAVAAAPNYADAVLLLSQLRLRTGNAAAVIAPLEALLKIRPDLLQARTLLADGYQAVGRQEDALKIVRDLVDANPRDARSFVLLGAMLSNQKKIDEARQAFEKAVAIDPANTVAVNQLVNLELQKKDFAAAHRRAQTLLEKQPNAAVAHLMEGRINAFENNFEGAEKALKKAIELDPNLTDAYNLLVTIYVSKNKLPEALRELDAILAKNPKDRSALMVAGLIYDKQGDYAKARDTYEKLLALDPNSVPALNNLAYLYSEKFNDLNRAGELARKAHDLAPNDPSVADTLGWIVYRQGNYQTAAELLQNSVAKMGDNPEVQFHFGMAQYMMGRSDEARGALQKAAAANGNLPWMAEAKNRLAMLSSPNAQTNETSVVDLENLTKQGNDPVALTRLAAAYEKQGAAQKASETYERAFQANPKLADAAMKVAELNAGALKNSSKALEYARKARDLAGRDPQIAAKIGRIAFQSGNYSFAYSVLQDAARQQPQDAKIAHDFAWAAYAVGKIKEAEEAMQRAANAPDSADASDAKSFLALLKIEAQEKVASADETQINQALATDANYVPALMAKAALAAQNNDTNAAANTYFSILQRWPDFAPAQKRLAAIYAQDASNADKAYDLASKARRSLPDDADLARTLGIISYQRKEYPRAIQLLQESDRKRPLDALGAFYLGMAHLQAGHSNEAKQTLTRAVNAGLREDLGGQAKRALEELEHPSGSPSPSR